MAAPLTMVHSNAENDAEQNQGFENTTFPSWAAIARNIRSTSNAVERFSGIPLAKLPIEPAGRGPIRRAGALRRRERGKVVPALGFLLKWLGEGAAATDLTIAAYPFISFSHLSRMACAHSGNDVTADPLR